MSLCYCLAYILNSLHSPSKHQLLIIRSFLFQKPPMVPHFLGNKVKSSFPQHSESFTNCLYPNLKSRDPFHISCCSNQPIHWTHILILGKATAFSFLLTSSPSQFLMSTSFIYLRASRSSLFGVSLIAVTTFYSVM